MAVSAEELEGEIPFLEIMGNLLLFLLVFGMAAPIDLCTAQEQLQNIQAISIGIIHQFIILPLLGFVILSVLDLDEVMGITLLVITSSPGGSWSNWWCSIFKGDSTLSIVMTTVSTLFSVVMLPLNILLYIFLSFDVDILKHFNWALFITSLFVIISANALGLYCSSKVQWQNFRLFAYKMGNLTGIALIIYSGLIITNEEEAFLLRQTWLFYIAVALPCMIGLLLSNIMTSYTSLAKPERVAVSIECCFQNVAIASSMALSMFKGPSLVKALSISLYYGFIESITVCIYCIVSWKIGWTKAPPDVNIYTLMMESHDLQPIEPPKDIYEIID